MGIIAVCVCFSFLSLNTTFQPFEITIQSEREMKVGLGRLNDIEDIMQSVD